MIKTDKYEYEVAVDKETGEIKSDLNKKIAVKDTNTVAKPNEEKDKVVKTTAEDQLNQELQEDMKDAITEHKDALDDLDKDDEAYKEEKEQIRIDFKDAKDEIKLERNPELEIKEDKKEATEPDNNDKDDKSVKLVKNLKVEPEEALLIALKSIGFKGTLDNIEIKLDADNEYSLLNSELSKLNFNNLKGVEIVLNSEDNPTTYSIELKYESDDENIINTIKIHATSGKILDYEKVEKVSKVENENIEIKVKENNGKNNK